MPRIIEKTGTESTNDDAKRLAVAGAEHLTVVWAHWQTAGRGRHQREWTSHEGNVFWSVVLRPQPDWPPVANLVYVNALAVLETVRTAIGPDAALSLKWPNDLLLGNRKVAGSLLEAGGSFRSGRPEWIVVGTGINVVGCPEFADVRYPPTSLHREGFVDVTRDALVRELGPNLAVMIDHWVRGGFGAVRDEYLRHAHGVDRTLRVGVSVHKSDYREGIYRGIDAEGAMLLELADGTIDALNSGDVISSA